MSNLLRTLAASRTYFTDASVQRPKRSQDREAHADTHYNSCVKKCCTILWSNTSPSKRSVMVRAAWGLPPYLHLRRHERRHLMAWHSETVPRGPRGDLSMCTRTTPTQLTYFRCQAMCLSYLHCFSQFYVLRISMRSLMPSSAP